MQDTECEKDWSKGAPLQVENTWSVYEESHKGICFKTLKREAMFVSASCKYPWTLIEGLWGMGMQHMREGFLLPSSHRSFMTSLPNLHFKSQHASRR